MRRDRELDNLQRGIEKIVKYFYGEDKRWIERRINHLIEVSSEILEEARKYKKKRGRG